VVDLRPVVFPRLKSRQNGGHWSTFAQFSAYYSYFGGFLGRASPFMTGTIHTVDQLRFTAGDCGGVCGVFFQFFQGYQVPADGSCGS